MADFGKSGTATTVDNLTSKNVNSGSIFTYGYDYAHQLTSESVPAIGTHTAFSYTLDYDANGNRKHKYWSSGNTDSYSYDQDDRLQSVASSASGTTLSYTYDSYLRPSTIGTSSSHRSMNWDVEDRMTSISQVTGGIPTTLGSYGYNGAGARVSKIVGTTSHTYARAGVGVTSPVVNESLSSGSPTNFVPGIGFTQGSAVRTTASDQLGTQNLDLDGSGSVVADREYDAFGVLQNGPRAGVSDNGYAGDLGYQEDDESGLKLVGHRRYDSGTGRFATSDIAHAGRNWGAYSSSNPTGASDPTGLDDEAQALSYGMWLRIAQMPPWLQGLVMRILGVSIIQMQNALQEGRALFEDGAEAVSDEAISVPGNIISSADWKANNVWQMMQDNFPTGNGSAPANSFGVRITEGKLNAIAAYDNWGQAIMRLDFFSRSGRADHIFPHWHEWLGDQKGWGGGIPGIPINLPLTHPMGSIGR